MTGFVDFKAKTTVWTSSKSRWKGRMKLQWRYVKDIPYKIVNHIKLDNNAGKPISFTQDCHDVPAEQGKEFLRISRKQSSGTPRPLSRAMKRQKVI